MPFGQPGGSALRTRIDAVPTARAVIDATPTSRSVERFRRLFDTRFMGTRLPIESLRETRLRRGFARVGC